MRIHVPKDSKMINYITFTKDAAFHWKVTALTARNKAPKSMAFH